MHIDLLRPNRIRGINQVVFPTATILHSTSYETRYYCSFSFLHVGNQNVYTQRVFRESEVELIVFCLKIILALDYFHFDFEFLLFTDHSVVDVSKPIFKTPAEKVSM